MLVQRFEPKGRHFTNFHYYYYDVLQEVMEAVTVNGEQYCLLKKVGRGGSAQVITIL